MKKGLFIGRFQPFHLGHLSAIKQALSQIDFLTIGIGSAQYEHQENNPFTSEERANMIKRSLMDSRIFPNQYRIIEIPDIHNDILWPMHVRSLTGEFDTLFLGNQEIVKELFEKHSPTPMVFVDHEVEISASEIRDKMKNGGRI